MLTVAVLCSVSLMIIGSRSAGLGMILLWMVHLIFRKDHLRWMGIAVIGMIILLPNTIRYRVTELSSVAPHAFSRLRIWEASLKMGRDHPLIGVGPGMFYEYGPTYAFPTEELPVRYGRIARKLGVPGGGRAVGSALAANPFPLLIPCHRAVRSTGELGGYQGGLEMKKALLEMEGVVFRSPTRVSLDKVYYQVD